MPNNGTFKKYIIDAARSVRNEIDKDPLNMMGIRKIIDDAGIGVNSFNKAFKLVAGCSFRKYRVYRKLDKGKEMLEQGKSIKEITRKLGYANTCNFSTAFKKRFGYPPTELQNSYYEAV